MLGANAEKGIDERIKELMRNDSDELVELMEREHLREELEPKYVIVRHGSLFEFRASYVDMHRTLLSSDEIRHGRCDVGGFWGVDALSALFDVIALKHVKDEIDKGTTEFNVNIDDMGDDKERTIFNHAVARCGMLCIIKKVNDEKKQDEGKQE